MGRRNHEHYTDTTPYEAFKKIIHVDFSAEEMKILLSALYWKSNEMVPDTAQVRQLYRKLYAVQENHKKSSNY
jgi:hypothetical protein